MMGVKQTKIQSEKLQQLSEIHRELEDPLDPRSPNNSRTPINLSYVRSFNSETKLDCRRSAITDNPLEMIRKRILQGFTYNQDDSRSPDLRLNRAPLLVDNVHEKSLNLNDTFANLFVESRASNKNEEMKLGEESGPVLGAESASNESYTANAQPQTPTLVQQQFDPRSPSIGVDRTPIIFDKDDGEESGDDVLEDFLETLARNLKSTVSSKGINKSDTISECVQLRKEAAPAELDKSNLEYLNVKKKAEMSQCKNQRFPRHQIYEDHENVPPYTTKMKSFKVGNDIETSAKRTPLSCMRNRSHLRSRSVELSLKSQKVHQIHVTTFDDNTNPLCVTNLNKQNILKSESQ